MTTPLTIPFSDPADDGPDLPDYVGISERVPRAELATIAHLPRTVTPSDDKAHTSPTAPDPDPAGEADQGMTRRVERLREQVAEARLLAELQADQTPLMLDSPKVRRRQRAAHEAARLHALAQDPAMRAWSAARMRRLLVAGAMVGLALALAWSTAGVQHFAADGAPAWSPGWLFAWFVEPFMSITLLVVVGARAYMATLGQPIRSKTLVRIEHLFLVLTVGMNAFPYLPGVADTFSFPRLMLHLIGPIVAVAVVTALPHILAAFAALDFTTDRRNRPLTGLTYGANIPDLLARAETLTAEGRLPASPSAYQIRRVLSCGMDDARTLRDLLADPK
ncbi:hypothetical protein GT755_19775 [Herbidospora sp. NEAU-GS84]|uniref:Conjugal transfer protein TraI n=1 Tax=Herbidospora solisilvae TaxID=2696284 RepID=A0A7C9J4X3_9ACTN|nr:hypothetical protein [Herbidospora solisilvae]NAS23920.1 hypothetical protein [Herbidospora solisilvae]